METPIEQPMETPMETPAEKPMADPTTERGRDDLAKAAAGRDALPGALACGLAIVVFLAGWLLATAPAIRRTVPFFTKGEPREALCVQTIARGEGFVLPLRNGDELPSKPPLFHWLAAGSALAAGRVDEQAIRLPGYVAAVATLAATALAAWRWWGPLVALATTLLLGTSFQWMASAVSARVDMVLTACTTLALLGFGDFVRRGRPVPAAVYLLVALATLAKGPVGMVLPIAVVLASTAARGTGIAGLGKRDLKLLALASAAAGLWYAAALFVGGEAFFAKQILKENVFRVLDPDSVEAGHVRPFWYYVPLLLAGMSPWSLVAPGLVAAWASGRRRHRDPAAVAATATPSPDRGGEAVREQGAQDPMLRFAAAWAVVPFLLFSLAGSKRAVYLLPSYPAWAMLLALAFRRLLAGDVGRGARLSLMAGCRTAAALLVVVSAAMLVAATGLLPEAWLRSLVSNADAANVAPVLAAAAARPLPVAAGALGLLGAALFADRASRRGRWMAAGGSLVLGLLLGTGTFSSVLLPDLAAARSTRGLMARVQEAVPTDARLYFYRAFDYGAVFYRQAPIPERDALSDVPGIDGAWLLTWPALLPELRDEVRKLDTGEDAAGALEVEEVIVPPGAEPSDRSNLVLVRIVRRIGDDHSDGI